MEEEHVAKIGLKSSLANQSWPHIGNYKMVHK
jgi:hypothetical protein